MPPKKSAPALASPDAPADQPVRKKDYTPEPTHGGQIAEDGTHTLPKPEPEWHRRGLPEPEE
jgi:hypothetical protein